VFPPSGLNLAVYIDYSSYSQKRNAVQFVQEMQLEFSFVHGSQPVLITEIPVRKFAVSGAVSWKTSRIP
jgi:hypothetical protein